MFWLVLTAQVMNLPAEVPSGLGSGIYGSVGQTMGTFGRSQLPIEVMLYDSFVCNVWDVGWDSTVSFGKERHHQWAFQILLANRSASSQLAHVNSGCFIGRSGSRHEQHKVRKQGCPQYSANILPLTVITKKQSDSFVRQKCTQKRHPTRKSALQSMRIKQKHTTLQNHIPAKQLQSTRTIFSHLSVPRGISLTPGSCITEQVSTADGNWFRSFLFHNKQTDEVNASECFATSPLDQRTSHCSGNSLIYCSVQG